MKWWDQMTWTLSFKPAFSLSSFTFIKRLFSSSSLPAIKVVSFCISKGIDIFPGNLDSSLCFIQPGIMYSAYKLNKQGDNIQPWRTPFPIWNQSVAPCPVLTVASWPPHRFLMRLLYWTLIMFAVLVHLNVFVFQIYNHSFFRVVVSGFPSPSLSFYISFRNIHWVINCLVPPLLLFSC